MSRTVYGPSPPFVLHQLEKESSSRTIWPRSDEIERDRLFLQPPSVSFVRPREREREREKVKEKKKWQRWEARGGLRATRPLRFLARSCRYCSFKCVSREGLTAQSSVSSSSSPKQHHTHTHTHTHTHVDCGGVYTVSLEAADRDQWTHNTTREPLKQQQQRNKGKPSHRPARPKKPSPSSSWPQPGTFWNASQRRANKKPQSTADARHRGVRAIH